MGIPRLTRIPSRSSVLTVQQFLALVRSLGLSHSEIGASLGVSHVSVSKWLSGERIPSPTVRLLAGCLWVGMPVDLPAGLPGEGS